MGHIKGQCCLLINLKKKRKISLVILGGTMEKQRVQRLHWLLIFKKSEGFNIQYLLKPHSSFISREKREKEKTKEKRQELNWKKENHKINSLLLENIYFIFGGLSNWIKLVFIICLSSTLGVSPTFTTKYWINVYVIFMFWLSC